MMHSLAQFLDTAVSSVHGALALERSLQEGGFQPFGSAEPGQPVVLRRDGTVYAIRPGTRPPWEAGMVILAAHTDSPALQLKHRSASIQDGFLQVPVEVYGGPILATWLDRDLGVAGRVATGSTVHPVAVPRPLGVIPNLAIHLNREVNEKLSYNRQDHLKVLFGPGQEMHLRWLQEVVAEQVQIEPDSILDMELNVIPLDPASVMTTGMICSTRIDNLAGCFSVLQAFRNAEVTEHTQVAIFYDHEEIGSTTAFGAAGIGTEQFLRRWMNRLSGGTIPLEEVLPRTVLVSNDAAHGRHPNYSDRHDSGYAPQLGGGPVIKKSAIRRYASELPVAAWFARCCAEAGVPVQYLQNRSDIAAGSTIGPAVASRLAVRSVDVGIPILGMHSVRETAAVSDVTQMTAALKRTLEGELIEVLDADSTR